MTVQLSQYQASKTSSAYDFDAGGPLLPSLVANPCDQGGCGAWFWMEDSGHGALDALWLWRAMVPVGANVPYGSRAMVPKWY